MCMDMITIKYNPSLCYNEIGYHKTYLMNKDSIIKNGFEFSHNDDDWLGEGVYFWDNIDDANWWNQSKEKGIVRSCIFECKLVCKSEKYLNLDYPLEMKKFDEFSMQYIKEMKNSRSKAPKFANNNQRKKFFCDLYCKKKNFEILSHTFKHDIINTVGFKVGEKHRRQICVRNKANIKIVSVKE